MYIGGGNAQLEFVADLDEEGHTVVSSVNQDTVATLTSNRMDGEIQVLNSTLRIRALLGTPNPSVTCVDGGSSTTRTTSFQVLGKCLSLIHI